MNLNPNTPQSAIQLQNQPFTPEPGRLQAEAVIAAQEVQGFKDCQVYLTTEKKQTSVWLGRKNEDNALADARTGLFGVMDGLGGAANGDQASKAVERVLPDAFAEALEDASEESADALAKMIVKAQKQKLTGIGDPDVIAQRLEKMQTQLAAADQQIAAKAWALFTALRKINLIVSATGGMTTASLGLIHRAPDGNNYAIVANIGDSGALIRRQDGQIRRLTSEDSGLDAMIRHGVKVGGVPLKEFLETIRNPKTGDINHTHPVPIPITPESCRAMAYTQSQCDSMLKNGKTEFSFDYGTIKAMVTNVLGQTVPPIPSLEIIKLEAGDELILATDGLIDKYENVETGETDMAELEQDAGLGSTPAEMLDILRVMAKQRQVSYKPDDDVTIVVAKAK